MFAGEQRFEPLAKFADELKSHALSSFAYNKGKAFMDGIAPGLPNYWP